MLKTLSQRVKPARKPVESLQSSRLKRRLAPGCLMLLAAALASLMAGSFGAAPPAVASALRTASAANPCLSDVQNSPLPVWARDGFHPPGRSQPHVISAQGEITAVLWAWPCALLAPPSSVRNNKILWVSKVGLTPESNLQISARRLVGSTLVGPAQQRVVIGGPGPSIINMPAAGCWRFTLRWSGHVDSVDLEYSANGANA